MILSGAEPFFLPGGPHGALLIHGFTGVPAELLEMGQFLQKRGFTVLAVRLAGHGTKVEDLVHMTWEDWMDSVRDGFAILSGCTEKISVIGHSMGGLFAMMLASESPVCRVVSLAAPIFIAEERGIKALPTREASVGQYVPKALRHLKGVTPVVNYTYRRMPLVSVHELLDVVEQMKGCIDHVKAPILIMHSRNDHTAAPESADYIYEHVASREKEQVWFTESGHLLPLEADKDAVKEKVAEFLEREYK